MSDYIKLFNTKAEQDAFLSSSGYKEPHISCTANGGNLRYNQSFVGILVGTNGSLKAYIKSTQLDAFISKRAVRAYSDATCTELIEGNLTFELTLTGIDEYYGSLETAYEEPAFEEFYVEDGIITYLEEQQEQSEFNLIGYLESDSSKKAYSSAEIVDTGTWVYSDDEGTAYAINGHYIGYGLIDNFNVSNGQISYIEKGEETEECEIYFFKIVKDDDTIPTPSKITYAYDEYTIQLDQQFSADSCSDLPIKVYFNNVLTINKSIAVTDHKLITIVRSGSGYDLVTSEYTPEEPEEPEDPDIPIEAEDVAEAFKVRVRLDPDSNIPTPRYINCDDGYGEVGDNFTLNTVVDTWVHRPSCDSLNFYAEINGISVSSSIRYFDLRPYPTVNDITLYEDGDGGYYFEIDYKRVTVNVHLAPGVPTPNYLMYSTEEEDNFSINTNCTFLVSGGFELYATIGGTSFHTNFDYSDVEPYPAVNHIYIYESTGGSGYYFSLSMPEEEEEEPEEESGVMPADGMDPDAGGGEDIVEEEPTDSPEEEVEEEP